MRPLWPVRGQNRKTHQATLYVEQLQCYGLCTVLNRTYLFVCVTQMYTEVYCSPADATACIKMVECDIRFNFFATIPSVFYKKSPVDAMKLSFSDRSNKPVYYRLQSQSRREIVRSEYGQVGLYFLIYVKTNRLIRENTVIVKNLPRWFKQIYTFSLLLNTESWFLANCCIYSVDM